MTTLILHSRYDEDTQLLWQAAVSRSWKTLRGNPREWVPFTDSLDISEPIAIYGSDLFAPTVAGQFGLSLVSPDDLWMTLRGTRVLAKREIYATSGLGFDEFSFASWPRFIKPVSGKSIPSRVYISFDDFLSVSPAQDEPFIVQESITFTDEHRFFVLNGTIVARSMYASFGAPIVVQFQAEASPRTSAAERYLNSVLPLLEIPRSVVVDVGFIEDRGWAIVELNPSWCSAVYNCNPDAVLDAVLACTKISNKASE